MLRSELHLVWRALGLWGVLACGTGCFDELSEADPPGDESEGDAGDPNGDQETDPDDGPLTPPTAIDLLFVIDNSGSMTEEQKKLNEILSDLVASFSSGRKSRTGPVEFRSAQSVHVGVVSTDMGVNGAMPQKSCGNLSFLPWERTPQTAQELLLKPLGDDGVLQTSTAVAESGIWAASSPGGDVSELVPADPSCAAFSLPAGQRFIEYGAGDDAAQAAAHFRCIAKLGKNGCGLEQQLEAGLKALTPASSALRFSQGTKGHGDGLNQGFLRKDAVLIVAFVSDEEDCSIPDASNAIFDATSVQVAGEINVRCGLQQNQNLLHNIQRYVDGLKALKPARYQDRIIVANAAGIPLSANTDGQTVHSGEEALDALLARPDMQFQVRRNVAGTADEPVPTCVSARGDGSAAPTRRVLELAKAFGDHGLVTSICEDSYNDLAQVVIDRVAGLMGTVLE